MTFMVAIMIVMITILYQGGGGGSEEQKIEEKSDEEEGRGRPGINPNNIWQINFKKGIIL